MTVLLVLGLVLLGVVVAALVVLRARGPRTVLAVTWAEDPEGWNREDPDPITWVVSPLLPKLLGATSTTIGRTTRSRIPYDQALPGHRRHEARHVWQQAGRFLPWWLLQYILIPSFRQHAEADAVAQEPKEWPQFRVMWTVP